MTNALEFDYDFTLLLLIFMRMSGCILFNPILGRRNLPAPVRIGLSLMLSIFTYPLVPRQDLRISSFLVMALACMKELLIGFVVGFIIQMFLSVIIMGGEQIDMQVGISMSRIYDPQSNLAMPLSASVINAMYLMIFFASNSHLTLVQVFVKLGMALPYGDQLLSANVFGNLAAMFSLMLIYSAQLALPMIAVQLIAQVGIGLMMRAVPQIDIFTIEVQLRLILGFVTILVLVPPLSDFIKKLISLMFQTISQFYSLMV